jgi:phosphoglycerate dehydrogenase-like enzyme
MFKQMNAQSMVRHDLFNKRMADPIVKLREKSGHELDGKVVGIIGYGVKRLLKTSGF